MRLRERCFSDNMVLGSKAFVELLFEAHRDQFDPMRKDGIKHTRAYAPPFSRAAAGMVQPAW